MAHGNLALARDYLADIRTFEERIGTLMMLDTPLVRLYGMRGKPDANGAISHNKHGFVCISYQRHALDLVVYGIAANDMTALRNGVNGIRYGFSKQTRDGGFEVSFLSRRKTDIGKCVSDSAAFLTAAAISYQLLHNSPYRRRFLKQLTEIRLGIRNTIYWLSKHDLKLFLHDQDSAYQLTNNALAYIICGEIYNNINLIKRGHIFLDIALELQRDDGAFLEGKGHDSSYQASTIVMLVYYMLFVQNRAYFNKVLRAIALGLIWEKSRILPTGKINSRNNTHRKLTYSTFSGRKTDINYSDVIKAFLWYAFFTHDQHSKLLAQRVYQFIRKASA
ncbi:MAG: hypothetical protein L0Z73_07600 [Gammaproteobacteria bacterium]|nr:hypothetical protein [Gammaproteobacteria bacterium]